MVSWSSLKSTEIYYELDYGRKTFDVKNLQVSANTLGLSKKGYLSEKTIQSTKIMRYSGYKP